MTVMYRIVYASIVLGALSLLTGCVSTPMAMRSAVEQGQARKISRVLIVTNGELFPEATRKMFFEPAVDSIRQMFAEGGVKSWSMALDKRSLNPGAMAATYAKQLEASHILFVTATKVASLGPRNSAVEYDKQLRLISSYELGFVLADVSVGRNVWKGELLSGSDLAGNDEEVRAVREKVQGHLIRTGFVSLPKHPAAAASAP